MMQIGIPIHPGCHWFHEPQTISDQPVGLGFPRHEGRYRPGGSLFSSPSCRSCRCMEGFMLRGCYPLLPGWSWISGSTNPSPRRTKTPFFNTVAGVSPGDAKKCPLLSQRATVSVKYREESINSGIDRCCRLEMLQQADSQPAQFRV